MPATEVDKTSTQGEMGEDEEELYQDESRSIEDLRHMRLMALLRDMIDSETGEKAAQTLGVSYRTVSRAVESGQLTPRMSAELERHLLLGGGSAAAQQRESIRALGERVEVLEDRVERGLENLRGVVEKSTGQVREEQAQGMRRLERQMAKAEAGRGAERSSGESPESVGKRGAKPAWRPYHDVVTSESEPGEERVYGDATPLIVEWRRVSAEFADAGDALGRATAEERMRELEIVLIEDRKLTLPPSTYPWDGFDRRNELWTRRQALERARVQRARAELRRRLRRVLTLGRWRN